MFSVPELLHKGRNLGNMDVFLPDTRELNVFDYQRQRVSEDPKLVPLTLPGVTMYERRLMSKTRVKKNRR